MHFQLNARANLDYLENMREEYNRNPEALDPSWQAFFAGYEWGAQQPAAESSDQAHLHAKLEALIGAYRRLGHFYADLDPLNPAPDLPPELLPAHYNLDHVAPETLFQPSSFAGQTQLSLADILSRLKQTYCGHIGADFRDGRNDQAIAWLQGEMEACSNVPQTPRELKFKLFQKLVVAETFENFLQTRFLGQKRFSIEGLESLIPLLAVVIDEANKMDVAELCMGMAHRGRLNVLAHTLGKPYEHIFGEFFGHGANPFDIDGDVKYHLGYASTVTTLSGNKVDLYLAPNPSHLEAVGPIVEGFSRLRQERFHDREQHLPILIHGDASMIGQGIVAETLNLSRLEDYETGGTLHIITNNQIGFTTDPKDSRSCIYASDISKMIHAPVFHVNADNPEAVAWAARLATRYRKRFHSDVVIDLIGYRRHGHNETDEPGFTQPELYRKIKAKKTVTSIYQERLEAEDLFSAQEFEQVRQEAQEALQTAFDNKIKPNHDVPKSFKSVFDYRRPNREEIFAPCDTQVSAKILNELNASIHSLPEGFTPHPKLARILKSRSALFTEGKEVDWSLAELLAFTSLSKEGHPVRLTGQDCKRGTFSHRHGVYFDYKTNATYEPLMSIGGAPINIVNSPLSEQGCLGFEFGYSVGAADSLLLWEAQFGDFANGAQIIIDQFLAASEAKWQQTSGMVLLLPHGSEGMGPEHSSARPERFLQSCGNLNMQVCNLTTPAQLFHMLRRQLKRKFRKPMVLMSPKSLLRHPKVRSPLSSLSQDKFHEVLAVDNHEPAKCKRAIFCTGKIYYELLDLREQYEQFDSAIIRIEQLYPFPFTILGEVLKEYKSLEEWLWVQEEPQNMGAWNFVYPRFRKVLHEGARFRYIGRKFSGSTAEGSLQAHQIEQQRILEEAFNLVCAWEPEHAKAVKL